MTLKEILMALHTIPTTMRGDNPMDRIKNAETDILTWLKDEIVPEEKKILDLNANIHTENEYVRHKERVAGHNACRDTMLKRLEGE